MTLKRNAKFKRKLTCGLKNDIRNLVNFHASSRKSENLHFVQMLLLKAYKDLDEKIQRSYISWQQRVMQSLKKNWLLVSNMTWRIWWIFTQESKIQAQESKNFTSISYFCPKYMRLELKKYRGVIFHDSEQWCKIWINPDLVVSKMAWGIGWTFIRALKVWKVLNWWAVFVKSIWCFS